VSHPIPNWASQFVEVEASGSAYARREDGQCFKLVRANNKNTWNWVGVSTEEYELALNNWRANEHA